MIIISEQKEGRRTVFVSNVVSESGELLSKRVVTNPLYEVEHEGLTYFLLYDDNMVLIREAYSYLNFTLRDKPDTTRSKAANALRLLYCFLSLTKHSIFEIDESVFGEFVYFIRGININPKEYSWISHRSNATVNGYFSIYRDFFKRTQIDCPPLFGSRTVLVNGLYGGDGSKRVAVKYGKNLRTNTYTDRYVPKYISPDDFRKIFKVAMAAGDKQAQIILKLMYIYGMRLGEVLGLTLEDIDEIEMDGKYIPVLWLRNRISDKKFQYAKNLPHVIEKKQYSSKDYKAVKEKIILTYEFFDELHDFLDSVFEEVNEKTQNNMKSALADIVTDKYEPDENYYIFLNRYGKVLSDQVWNKRLRGYFVKCNLIVDTGVKENNLSHRFRHGFAMFHARFSPHPIDALALQKMMRHRSIMSTMVYYNPTPEDEFEIKTNFQKDLYKPLPELSKGVIDEQ